MWIDKEYTNKISHQLRNFRWKSKSTAEFSCPLCGDSKKKRWKKRGYLYKHPKKNGLMYKCHNCGKCLDFKNFLKRLDENAYKEYVRDSFLHNNVGRGKISTKEICKSAPSFSQIKVKKNVNLPSIITLPENHPAKRYIKKRKIPMQNWNLLFYCENFQEYVSTFQIPDIDTEKIPKDKRIVIPFFDKDNKMFAFQGRIIDSFSEIRYITIKIDESKEKIYGLERWNQTKHTFIVEGPIDSLFLSNCLAFAGSDLNTEFLTNLVNKKNTTLIFDNEPRNKSIIQKMNVCLDNGFSVCIWPNWIRSKDINEMVCKGMKNIEETIRNNSFTKFKGLVNLKKFSKI